mmetsp:Transcript_5850/g.11601  ORF Transcript_5850/g.11601 Transcript_5850/m.11601 type:complete len:230 (+) Transcript_5850:2345-3034(+)
MVRLFRADIRELHTGHFIHSESPSLIGTDHGGATEGLYGIQLPDDCSSLSHSPGTQCQTESDNSRKTFRNGCDSQGNSDFQVVNTPFNPAPVCRIIELAVIHHPNKKANHTDNIRELNPELIKLFFQWALTFFILLCCFLNLLVNLSDFCFHAGSDYDSFCRSSGNNCSRECHVLLFRQKWGRSILAQWNKVVIFEHWLRLPSQGGLFTPQGSGPELHYPNVCRYLLTD